MAQRSSNFSDNSYMCSSSSYHISEGSGIVSGIIATRSVDSEEENDMFAEVSVYSDLHNNPQMISGRGALISGMAVPSVDSDEEIEYDGITEDMENGVEPPDSDYASRVPPQFFPNTLYERRNENTVSAMTADGRSNLSGKSGNGTERSEDPVDDHVDNRLVFDGKKQHSKRFWYMVLFTSLVTIGAIIAVAVAISSSGDLSSNQQEIHDIIISISGEDAIANKYSSQRKAHKWMVHQDKYFAEKDTLDRNSVVQRYVLAVFYFATNGPLWKQNNWLQGGECNENWIGIECNNQYQVLSLSLDTQGLSGTIPIEIGHLSTMQNFVISHEAGLGGNIPSTIGKLSSLRQLSFTHNRLESTIPSELYLATALSYVNLDSNDFSGSLSKNVGGLRNLQTLVLTNNTFHGAIPFDDLADTSIKYLGLGSNRFEGSISQSIRDLSDLQYLYLDHNEKIIGEIPVSLGGATKLRSINFDFMGITGRLPAILGRLKELEYLSIQGCKLYGTIPGEINLLNKLKTLNLISNQFTGELPTLSALTNLNSLLLVGNKFRGPIDDKLANLRSLEFLFLSSNSFTGPIPTFIGRPEGFSGSSLKGLYLSENEFNGTIPESLCDYTKLEALFLDHNHLSGSIPPCIGNLVEMRQLYVFHNNLTGVIPSEISTLRELQGLGVEHNAFVGDVSNEICDLASANKGFNFWSDCGGEQPELSCPCCNVCCPSTDCV